MAVDKMTATDGEGHVRVSSRMFLISAPMATMYSKLR
jgi:hypothetical protein